MNELGNSTILPLALWLNKPPIHKISSIIYLDKIRAIVTGCESGQIVIWQAKVDGDQMTPHHYIIGHKSKVTHFVLAGSENNTRLEYFASFSGDGELALWEAEEGRNIEFISNSQMNIQQVFSSESVNTKQRLIFCCLKNREIFILNSMSLSHICTLICTSTPNWFSSITSFNSSTKEDVVLATTVSGLLSMWVINFSEVFNQKQTNIVIDAEKYVDITIASPFKIVHNIYCTEVVLIISPCQFKIYHTQHWEVLSYQNCRRSDYFIDGDFITGNTVLIHCQSGRSFYYRLPPRANYQSRSFMEHCSNIVDYIPNLLHEFPLPNDIALIRHKVFTYNTKDKFTIWKGYTNGNIYKWEYSKETNENLHLAFSLESEWMNLKKPVISLVPQIKNESPIGVVTTVAIINDLSLIVLGMESGLIIIQSIHDTLASAFAESYSYSNSYITLKGHVGAVTCLMHPSTTMKLPKLISSSNNFRSKSCLNLLKFTHVLWSGGVDYTIRVWNIKSKNMINIFHCHSAPVMLLKLNHLPLNSAIICGFSRGFTAAMFSTVNDDEENSQNTKQMINRCMNSYLVGIGENDGISIFSVMKQKLLLYTAGHKSPVRNLGWNLDSGYLLIDTMENIVYVWDLASGVMDRFESGFKAQSLIENCSVITKIRTKQNYYILNSTKTVRRHSLSINSISDSSGVSNLNRLFRCQFIHDKEIDRYVPVLIFNLSVLLDSLDGLNLSSTTFYDALSEMDCYSLEGSKKSSTEKKKISCDLDLLMNDLKIDKHNLNLKILLIKIILSQTNLCQKEFQFSQTFRSLCSFGRINSKTGCITFDLKSLFQEKDSSKETKITTENLIIQLSIANKFINFSNSSLFDSFWEIYTMHGSPSGMGSVFADVDEMSLSTSLNLNSSKETLILFKNLREAILNQSVPKHLQILKGEVTDLSFNLLEKIFNRLIFGILDICETISKSSFQLLSKIITNLTDHQIQNFILVWRLFFCPHLNIYENEDGKKFLNKIQPFLDKFIEYSYLSSDWMWWYSKDQINTDHEKRNLSKIQIKAILNIALLGSHLHPDDDEDDIQDTQLFSKLFSLDKSFLARITCDFFMSVLSKKPKKSKSNIGRLINLVMICLSNGFLVWEPYLDSNTVICKFLNFAVDLEDSDMDDKFLSLVSQNTIKNIAAVRPTLLIMVCYREMLKVNAATASLSGSRKIDRRKSSPSLSSLIENSNLNAENPHSILNRNILVPIFNDLCEKQSSSLSDVLPELVELYVYFYLKEEDFTSFMLPVLRFSSVSLNELSGHISVGSVKGFLILFDLKFGKYFSIQAHKKSIRLTKFSDDSKLLASYSLHENLIKIWQVTLSQSLLGNHSYQVKSIGSHEILGIEQMFKSSNITSRYIKTDNLLEKVSDIYLEWGPDNKALFLKINGTILTQIKV